MTILGIDPGTARVGWCIVQLQKFTPVLKGFGLITTEKDEHPAKRLLTIYEDIETIIQKYEPQVLSLEELYFSKNVATALPVGQARGVILLAAAQHNMSITSYSPLTVKRAITGQGNADKKQVQAMIVRLMNLKKVPTPDDVADAIAIALTHAYTHHTETRIA